MRGISICLLFVLILAACVPPTLTPTQPVTATLPPVATEIPSATPLPTIPPVTVSKPLMQVFILNPLRTCIAADDFMSGNVCMGEDCGDCNCTREQFDPPSPLTGISPAHINDPQYAQYKYHECFEITLNQFEVKDIIEDMRLIQAKTLEWSGGALDLQLEFYELPVDFTGFTAPDFIIGPFEIDDEFLDDYVTTATDFVYVVNGYHDPARGRQLAYECGSSYGELSIRGAGFSGIQFNDICNYVWIDGQRVYEPLIHEWLHNLDWALYEINHVPDQYQFVGPDWAAWQHGTWPACGQGNPDPLAWFPSADLCEWDPDWQDCNNTASAGVCLHAGEVDGGISWYEHVLSVHYPRTLNYLGNYCRDGVQDFGESGVDSGWPCE